MILVDTNVWSEATKAEPNEQVRSWAAAHEGDLWLSAIVLAELRAGVALLPQGKKRSALHHQIEAIAIRHKDRILDFDERASAHYARIVERARNAGRPIQAPDAMIAATALASGMKVATRDAGAFEAAGVELIDPWQI